MENSLNRRGLALLLAWVLWAPLLLAQSITVKGTVKDTDGLEVIGATILVEGHQELGASTNLDGQFILKNVPANAVLQISYVGMKSQRIDLQRITTPYDLTIILESDSKLLDEVVVTALGIKRSEKALSYNVQELKSEDLTTAKDANFLNSLTGKVAGLNINTSSSGPGSATKVVMRGTKSVDGNNNALYVIDGVPMYSMTGKEGKGQFDSWGTTEGMADLNPDDIASISVLTGAAAAALYGSAAANGAILITTKKGEAGTPSISYSLNMDWGKPLILPQLQNRYGSGGNISSWGNRLPDGQRGFDVQRFFQTAANATHSFSLSGGTEKNQTYLSASMTDSRGLVPNNAYQRYNFSARNTTSLLNDRFTIDVSANYIIQSHRNFVNQGEYMNPLTAAYLMPRSESNEQVENFERYEPNRNIYITTWGYGTGDYTLQNPYWVAYRNLRESKRERYMLSLNLGYELMKWSEAEKWSLMGRVRTDHTAIKSTDKRFASTAPTLDMSKNGYYGEMKGEERQTYLDLISTLNKSFEVGNQTISLNATLGASLQDTRYHDSSVRGPLRDNGIPNLFSIFNINQNAEKTHLIPSGWIEQVQSIFGSAEMGLNSYLFLTLTGRNDWASQLANSPNSSFFYPSVGLSILPLEILSDKGNVQKVLNYLQIRTSYASVASPFQRGLTTPTYALDQNSKVYKNVTHFPVGALYPERTNSFEVGFSSRWWSGLFTLDATYYRTNTYNQTILSKVSPTSGYTGIYIQTGNVQNQGIELSAGLNLGSNESWAFSSNFTLGYNKNEIIELADNYYNPLTGEQESQNFLERGSFGTMRFILKKGGTLGDIYSNADFQRDANGRVVVSGDGNLSQENFANGKQVKLGSVLPDFTTGWSNELSYKGLSIGATLSGRVGGVVVSMTQAALDHYGVSETTAQARDNGFVMVDGITLDPEKYFSVRGKGRIAQYYTYDATNFRLQEAHISYRLKRKTLWNIADVTLSLVGRNLAFLYNKAPFDPEAVSSTGNYAQGLDYFMLPTQRTIGFNVKVNF